LGESCVIHAGSVLGSDGFGFAPAKEGIDKVRQVGKLVIEQDVEIGACCTIDRGTFTETHIGRGTKLDNMVHIGHNCKLGEYCLIAAQTGLAGSTVIGDRVLIGGQVGFAGHQVIGDDCIFFAKSGISGDVPPKSRYFGYPAKERMTAHRESGYISRLGELFKRVKKLEKILEEKGNK
ncbi:UDP-3-O-(3-hydroxymyristoyl)glucosamine N-acyltransferase, partial [bacterium]